MLGAPLSASPELLLAGSNPPEHRRITVKSIVDSCTSGSWAMPDIQRDVVWSPDDAAELLRSIVAGRSVSNMIGWRSPDSGQMQLRGSPSVTPEIVLLDGQQRSTALTAMLTSTGRPSWCVSANSVRCFDAIRSKVKVNLLTGEIATVGAQGNTWVTVPEFISIAGTPELLDRLGLLGMTDPSLRLQQAGLLDSMRRRILEYGVSVEVCTGSDAQATEQFLAINRSGKKLRDEDMLLAALTLRCPSFRSEFDRSVATLQELGLANKQIPSSLLRSVAVYHSLVTGEPIRSRIEHFTAQVHQGNFDKLVQELKRVTRAWEDLVLYLAERGVETSRLSSYNALVPLSVAAARWDLLSVDDDRVLALLLVGNRIARYQKHSTDSHEKDAKLLKAVASGEEFISGLVSLYDEYARTQELQLATTPAALLRLRKSVLGKHLRTTEYISLAKRRGWSDPLTGQRLHLRSGHSQWHHVLPENFAKKLADVAGVAVPDWVDSLPNLMVVRSETNRHYSDTQPAVALLDANADALDAQLFSNAPSMCDLESGKRVVMARAAELAYELDWPLRLLGL